MMQVGRFTVRGRLGEGGMGIVYDATTEDGRPVALKVMAVDDTNERHRMLVSRFLREARLLRKLDHRSIVRIIDAGLEDGFVFLAMERIEGASLRVLHEQGPLPLEVLAWVGAELASAVDHLHRSGIVHRDIKPSNVLIDRTGLPRLIDFGVATYFGATSITRHDELIGTLGFIAPEMLDGKATPLADQYSLGRLLIALASPMPRPNGDGKSRALKIIEGMEIDWKRFPRGGRWPILQVILQRMAADPPEKRFDRMGSCAKLLALLARAAAPEAGAVERLRVLVSHVEAMDRNAAFGRT